MIPVLICHEFFFTKYQQYFPINQRALSIVLRTKLLNFRQAKILYIQWIELPSVLHKNSPV